MRHRLAFSLVEWAATRLGGMNELALRAAALAAGVVLLIAFKRLASRLLEPHAAWFAVALAALSPALVYFSNEAKAYGIDALLAVLAMASALDVLDTTSARAAWMRLFTVAGVALLISIPAGFVVAGIGIALATSTDVRRHSQAKRRLTIGAAVALAAFAAVYLGIYRQSAADRSMQVWWQGGFLTPWSPQFFRRTWAAARTMMGEYFVGGRPEWFAVVLAALWFLVGLRAIAQQRGRAALAIVAGPIAAALAASAIQVYPVAPRTMLFTLPSVIIALAAGVGWTVDRLPVRGRPPALGLAGVLWLGPASSADLDRAARPQLPEDPRRVVEEFNRNYLDHEPVYVAANGIFAWLFYTTDWAAPDTVRIRRMRGEPGWYHYRGRCELIGTQSAVEWRIATGDNGLDPSPPWANTEAGRIRSAARPFVWVFFSHYFTKEKTALLDGLKGAGGRTVYAYETDGAALYRYRFDKALPWATPASPRSATAAASDPRRSVSPFDVPPQCGPS